MTDAPHTSDENAEPREWLIRKRGYYYRPDRAGYTASVDEAGRYTEREAKAEATIEPRIMSAVHQSAVGGSPVVRTSKDEFIEWVRETHFGYSQSGDNINLNERRVRELFSDAMKWRKRPAHETLPQQPVASDVRQLLVNLAAILDGWKQTAPQDWTDWDQQQRNGITRYSVTPPKPLEHVCGLQGFGRGGSEALDDTCPACEANAKKACEQCGGAGLYIAGRGVCSRCGGSGITTGK